MKIIPGKTFQQILKFKDVNISMKENSRGHADNGRLFVGPLATVLLSQQHPYCVFAQSGTAGIGGAGDSEIDENGKGIQYITVKRISLQRGRSNLSINST